MKNEKESLLSQVSIEQQEKMISTLKQAYKAVKKPFPQIKSLQEDVLESVLSSILTPLQDLGLDENGNKIARRLNVYTDGGKLNMVTVEVNEGNAPLMAKDTRTGLLMKSLCYIVPQDIEPTHEWYKPCLEEHKLLSPLMRGHVTGGGLLLRRIGEGYKTSFKNQIRKLTNKHLN